MTPYALSLMNQRFYTASAPFCYNHQIPKGPPGGSGSRSGCSRRRDNLESSEMWSLILPCVVVGRGHSFSLLLPPVLQLFDSDLRLLRKQQGVVIIKPDRLSYLRYTRAVTESNGGRCWWLSGLPHPSHHSRPVLVHVP